jgi:predicted dehydrogenase
MKTLRGAVIGYGFISGEGHLPAYLERGGRTGDVEIVAVADICEGRRAVAARALPGVRIYPDYRALLEAEKGGLDFVDIATPPCDHAEVAHAALDLGLHVLCEKPLAVTVAEARSMLDHAARARRVLFPCHNYKHAPVVKEIRRIVESGRIGQVRSITLNTFRNTHAKGVLEWHPHWRREKRYGGGGIAMDHGSHSFYLMFEWLRSYPTAVTAKMSNLDPRFDTEDNFSAALTFPTGMAYAYLTWTAGTRKVIYTVQGTGGAVTVDDDQVELAIMRKTEGPDVSIGAVAWDFERYSIASHWMDSSHVSWFSSLFDEFRAAVLRGDFVGKEIRESLRCIELIHAAYRSAAESCREVAIEGI